MNRIDEIVAHRVREARVSAGLTQPELGKALNLTPQQVSKYEKGRGSLTLARLAQIAEALDQPIQSFLPDSETPTKPEPLRREAWELLSAYNQIGDQDRRRLLRETARAFVD